MNSVIVAVILVIVLVGLTFLGLDIWDYYHHPHPPSGGNPYTRHQRDPGGTWHGFTRRRP